MTRVSPRSPKGAALKGRIVVCVLSLGLLGAGAGGVVAASGGSANGLSAAAAQYLHCQPGTHRVGNRCVPNKPPRCPAPTAITDQATGVSMGGADLHGDVKPGSSRARVTGWFFEYGRKRDNLGNSTPVRSTTGPSMVTRPITVEFKDTKYFFRLAATNHCRGGTTSPTAHGDTLSFQTKG